MESFNIRLNNQVCKVELGVNGVSALDGTLTKFAKIKTKCNFTLNEFNAFKATYKAFEDRLDVDNAPPTLLKEYGTALSKNSQKVKVANGEVTREIRVDTSDAAEFQKVIDSFKKTIKSGNSRPKAWTPTSDEEFEELKIKFSEKVLLGELVEKVKGKDKKFSNLFCQKLMRLKATNQSKLAKWTKIYGELKGLNSESDKELQSIDSFLEKYLNSDEESGNQLNVPPPNSQNVTYSGCIGFCWAVLDGNKKEDFVKFNIYAKTLSTMKQLDKIAMIPKIAQHFPKMMQLSDETQSLNSCPYRKTQICFVNRMSNIGLTLKLFRTVDIDTEFIRMLITMNNIYEANGIEDDKRNSNQLLHESLFNSKDYYEVDNFITGSTARVVIKAI